MRRISLYASIVAILLVAGCSVPGVENAMNRAEGAADSKDSADAGPRTKMGGRSGAPQQLGKPGTSGESDRAEGGTSKGLVDKETPAANAATDPATDPESTFAIDVDTASYDYARRVIGDGRMPDRADVRPEEFVNAFRMNYPEPRGEGIAVQADGFEAPTWYDTTDNTRIVRVGLQTRSESAARRQDARLTFVVDVSGSMAEPGRLDLVKDALHTLVDELRSTDAVAIVAYSTDARVLREMTPVTEKASLHKAIDGLTPQDSTNLEAGLVKGYEVARDGMRRSATNRVILLSDGLANVGNTTPEPILKQVEENAGKQIALLGVGVGSEYGDRLMEQLADKGDGFVVYVQEEEQARRLFVQRLPATLTVRARDAKVQVRFDPATVKDYRLIGFENRAVADRDFRNDAVDGGEVGPGHSVTAVYAVRLKANASGQVATATTRWTSPLTGKTDEASTTVAAADLAVAESRAAPRLRLAHLAAAFAEQLRDGRVRDPGRLAGIADSVASGTEDKDVRVLAALIRETSRLS